MRFSREQADRDLSEAWVMGFFIQLYKSQYFKDKITEKTFLQFLSKEDIEGYRSRLFWSVNIRMFEVMLGEKTFESLSTQEQERFLKLTKTTKQEVNKNALANRRRTI